MQFLNVSMDNGYDKNAEGMAKVILTIAWQDYEEPPIISTFEVAEPEAHIDSLLVLIPLATVRADTKESVSVSTEQNKKVMSKAASVAVNRAGSGGLR